MYDQISVRILRRIENGEKEREAIAYAELLVRLIAIDRLTFDVFHDEIRNAVRGHSSIEQSRDVGMIQSRENLTFAPKSFDIC